MPLLVIVVMTKAGERHMIKVSGDGGLENAQSVEREPESALDCRDFQDSVPSIESS
jgi:hypothetical protein